LKRFFINFSIVLLIFTFQATMGDFIKVLGIKPDLILVLTCMAGLLKGKNGGGFAGIFVGLFQDILYGSFIGLNALAKSVTGYVVGIGAWSLYKGNLIIPFFVVFLGSIFHEIVVFCVLFALSMNPPFIPSLINTILPFAFYNGLIAVVLFKPVKKLRLYFVSL